LARVAVDRRDLHALSVCDLRMLKDAERLRKAVYEIVVRVNLPADSSPVDLGLPRRRDLRISLNSRHFAAPYLALRSCPPVAAPAEAEVCGCPACRRYTQQPADRSSDAARRLDERSLLLVGVLRDADVISSGRRLGLASLLLVVAEWRCSFPMVLSLSNVVRGIRDLRIVRVRSL
jgi:hypothetical protein